MCFGAQSCIRFPLTDWQASIRRDNWRRLMVRQFLVAYNERYRVWSRLSITRSTIEEREETEKLKKKNGILNDEECYSVLQSLIRIIPFNIEHIFELELSCVGRSFVIFDSSWIDQGKRSVAVVDIGRGDGRLNSCRVCDLIRVKIREDVFLYKEG